MAYLDSDQEEADTKLVLNAVDATASGATSIQIFSPDTNVFVLALRRYLEPCEDTSFVTGRGQRHRSISLGPIVRTLGPARTAALPGFHALSRADITGSFAGKGKLACWKTSLEADHECVTALADLASTPQPTPDTFAAIEIEASLPAVLTKNANIQCERSEVVPFPEETGRVRKTSSIASCSERGHNACPLPNDGVRQRHGTESRPTLSARLWMDNGTR